MSRQPNAIRYRAERRALLASALIAAAGLAPLAAPASTAGGIAPLGQQALALLIESRAALPESGTALYAGATLDGVLLRELRVQVDGGATVRYQFSEQEARALNAGGLKRLPLALGEGPHHLRADVVAREAGGKPSDTRIAAQIERQFDGGLAQELRFSTASLGMAGRLELLPATADAEAREADYLLASDRAFEALLRLGTMAHADAQREAAASAALAGEGPAAPATATLARYNAGTGA
ncbi:MAG: hypothetical protein ACREVL_03645, partial [Solimonas sp.]